MQTQTVVNDGNVVLQVQPTNANDSSAVMHRSLNANPPRVISAKGSYLELENGQKIFDATGGAAVSCIGHCDPRYVINVRYLGESTIILIQQ